MADKKKKRTILLSEDPSEVTLPSFGKRAKRVVKGAVSGVRKHVRPKSIGFGGTIGEYSRRGKPPVKVKWRAGLIKSKTKGKGGPLRDKIYRGFRIKVKF